jgi:hypothetical protein
MTGFQIWMVIFVGVLLGLAGFATYLFMQAASNLKPGYDVTDYAQKDRWTPEIDRRRRFTKRGWQYDVKLGWAMTAIFVWFVIGLFVANGLR